MVVIDIETTGLDPLQHSILEIGALDFNNPSNQFYQKCRVFEGAAIDKHALIINGYNDNQLYDLNKQGLEDLLLNFIEWIKPIENKTLAGQNVDFDILFLNVSLNRCNIDWILGWRKIDLHTLVYCDYLKKGYNPLIKNEVSNLSGDQIMKYVGIPPEPKPHTSINGVKYEAEAFSRLIYGKSLITAFRGYNIPTHFNN